MGDAQKNNGAVLLLVPGEGKGWLTVGAGLEDYLTAGVLDEILNTYCWGYFDNGDYDAAVVNTVGALLEQYESYYGISLANATGTTAAPTVRLALVVLAGAALEAASAAEAVSGAAVLAAAVDAAAAPEDCNISQ